MRKTSRIAALLILAVAVSIVLGCSLIPQGISGLFATKTPTSTVTPTVTATPTATPIPPVSLTSCAFQSDCPDVKQLVSFYDGKIEAGTQAYVQFPNDNSVRISIDWVAIDQQHLDDNLQHLTFFFKIDGVSYKDDSMFKNGVAYDAAGNATDNPGLFMGVVLSGWKVGYPHTIEYGYVVDSTINDGWDDYQPQTVKFSILAMPLMLPTSTPTLTETPIPTATNTPRPIIYTPRPTAIPVQPTAADQDSSSNSSNAGTVPVTVTNNTSHYVKIVAVGPASSYTLYLNAGETKDVQWVPGDYTVTAYMDGSYYASTTYTVNEEHAIFTLN